MADDLVAGMMIRQLRSRSGLTQAQLAARTGVPRPVLSAYERGRRQPSVAMLARLARAAGVALTLDRGPSGIDAAVNGAKLYDVLSLVDAMPVDATGRPDPPVLDVWRR